MMSVFYHQFVMKLVHKLHFFMYRFSLALNITDFLGYLKYMYLQIALMPQHRLSLGPGFHEAIS